MNKKQIQSILTSTKFDPRDPQFKEIIEAGPEYCRLRALEEIRERGCNLHAIRLLIIGKHLNGEASNT